MSAVEEEVDFLFAAGSLTCEGRTGWASEVTIHVYEEWRGGEKEGEEIREVFQI